VDHHRWPDPQLDVRSAALRSAGAGEVCD
jgi:hypothetical protein